MEERAYIAIDLKSFYASVECMERGLDPLKTNLVVADASRTEKTICLAVSPSLKAWGVSGRPRLFEVVQKIAEVNNLRKEKAPGHKFTCKSEFDDDIRNNPSCEIDYLVARPRMAKYIDCSTKIYEIYLKYISAEDIHVYSIDEVFMDVTNYLNIYKMSPHDLAMKIIHDVLKETGITATAGIGTNLYLCKIAMDIVAKHIPADKDGVRIAELDEMSYRKLLWNHRPITDFWRIGHGIANRLAQKDMHTMGDIARCSVGSKNDYYNEDLLYKMFGKNAELIIDHAWGWEPCTIKEIKDYKPSSNSLSSGQVLSCPYDYNKALLIAKEMTDALALDVVRKELLTDQMVLTIIYDPECLSNPDISSKYHGPIDLDYYGREVPRYAHGTANLSKLTSSSEAIIDAVVELYKKIVNPDLLVRRIYVVANHIVSKNDKTKNPGFKQMDLFTDFSGEKKEIDEKEAKEKRVQKALLDIKKRYGANAVLKGMNFEEGGTARDRNNQIGGHRA